MVAIRYEIALISKHFAKPLPYPCGLGNRSDALGDGQYFLYVYFNIA
jgi:hypothetical protein